MVRLNITLPDEVARELKTVKNKSRFIATVVHEKFVHDKKEKLKALLIEGYKQNVEEDRRINQEWEEATLNDGWD